MWLSRDVRRHGLLRHAKGRAACAYLDVQWPRYLRVIRLAGQVILEHVEARDAQVAPPHRGYKAAEDSERRVARDRNDERAVQYDRACQWRGIELCVWRPGDSLWDMEAHSSRKVERKLERIESHREDPASRILWLYPTTLGLRKSAAPLEWIPQIGSQRFNFRSDPHQGPDPFAK